MANVLNELIDVAITALNAETTFSLSFTAVRKWQHQYTPKEYETLRVTLLPVKMETERAGRGLNQEDYQFDVVVQQKPDTTANSDVDDLGDLLQEITDWFGSVALAPASGKVDVMKREWPAGAEAGYHPDHLREFGIYTGVLRVTCRMHRA
ncbi:MAG: hypothetical protein PHU85_03940 [Phycisphaerae bacterium]|nr:hypothetical protein [Phycisphaerae bacterium]